MRNRKLSTLELFAIMMLLPHILRPQVIPHAEIMNGNLQTVKKQTWNIFGKVTNLRGDPLRDAAVRVDIGYGTTFIRNLTTNAQGEFRTEYNLDTSTSTSLAVKLEVEREGYAAAQAYTDFGVSDKTWEIDIAMLPDAQGEFQLPIRSLIQELAPKLRAALASDATIASARKDFEQGASDFLDRHDAAKAVPSLTKLAKHYLSCGHCRTFLGLALLDAGSWNDAAREFAEAGKIAEAGGSNDDKGRSFLIAAEMENWKGEYAKAAGFLMKAITIDSNDAFVIQELGRTLIFQQNWEAAEQSLSQALAAGAPKEALMLRAEALLEEGDPEAADTAMKRYLADSDLKNSPMPVRKLAAQIDEHMKLRTYAKVQSVVSQPLPDLVKAVPELAGLDPASSQEELPAVLHSAGENVGAFFTNFQNTTSLEQIVEERLSKDGKVKGSLDQKFRYLLLTRPLEQGLGLQEFRTDLQGKQSTPGGLGDGLMLTSGFASASLLFHPAYQSGASFKYLGRQSVKGHPCFVVAFAQKPETARMVERFDTNLSSSRRADF